ncbi:MAG: gamma-glutamyltransferase family protein [Pseudomonadota bacterium]
MAACSHPLATTTAVDVLRSGGNAVDAAIAAAAVLAVVEPSQTGIGGDMFAIVAPKGGAPVALNGSGAAPTDLSPERLHAEAVTSIAQTSPHAVTVPGALAGWHALAEAYGSRPLGDLLEPAIVAARDGVRVTARVAWDWERAAETLRADPATAAAYLPNDRAPALGDRHRLPTLALTLAKIAKEGVRTFYQGEVAERMVASLRAVGGTHQMADFAAAEAEWVKPIATDHHGVTVHECPPNGQGIIALLMLNMLADDATPTLPANGAPWVHLLAEATRLAYRERDASLADPRVADVPTAGLLDPGFATALRREIVTERAMTSLPPRRLPPHPDTVYLSVVDRDGTSVSFINSIYDLFGSTLTCAETGVLFHSRGRAFSLEPGHPNGLAPGKRPMHTIIPAMAYRSGRPWLSFGVMGGDYQPVGQVQVLKAILDHGLDPQAALELPRSFAYPDDLVVEAGIPDPTVAALERAGHRVTHAPAPLGGGQAILIDHARGVFVGGTDPRKDGLALGL